MLEEHVKFKKVIHNWSISLVDEYIQVLLTTFYNHGWICGFKTRRDAPRAGANAKSWTIYWTRNQVRKTNTTLEISHFDFHFSFRAVIKKRKDFEYKLQKQTKRKEDYLKYIQYEINLLTLVRIRRQVFRIFFSSI